MLARLVETACHREEQGEDAAQTGIEDALVPAGGTKLLDAVDRLVDRRRAVAERQSRQPDEPPPQDFVAGGVGMGDRPLAGGEALVDSSLTNERRSEQLLGQGKATGVAEPCEGLDGLFRDRKHLRRPDRRVRAQPADRAPYQSVHRDAALLKTRCGVTGSGKERLGFGHPAGLEVEVAELDLNSRALAVVSDPELERGREPQCRLGECARRLRRLRREQVVLDGALRADERGGEREVMGELGQHARQVGGVALLERFADAQVELRQAHARDPVVDRATDELVREAARGRRRGHLLDDPAPRPPAGRLR